MVVVLLYYSILFVQCANDIGSKKHDSSVIRFESFIFTTPNIPLSLWLNSSIFDLNDHKAFLQKTFGLSIWAAANVEQELLYFSLSPW